MRPAPAGHQLDEPSARRRYLILLALRWLPVGLTIPVSVLLVTSRGLSLTEFGIASAAQGVLIFLLELPTGGLADVIGRKRVLVAATAIDAGALVVFLGADTVAVLLAVYALRGVSRALDSGPLDAWYVDAAVAADPDANYEITLARGGAVLGMAIAAGAGLSGLLVALGGVGTVGALEGPLFVAIVCDVVAVVALSRLLAEVPRQRSGDRGRVAQLSEVIRSSLGLLRRSRFLVALVCAEVLWSLGMVTFEVLTAPRMAELLGDVDRASALMGPVTAVAWIASAVGSALVPALVRRTGPRAGAAFLRIFQGVAVVGMGLAGGVLGLIVAFTATYAVHGAANPVHQGLLHRQVEGDNRATVISLNSMVGMPAGAIGGVTIGWLAEFAGLTTAMVVGGAILASAAPLYFVARRPARHPIRAGVGSGA